MHTSAHLIGVTVVPRKGGLLLLALFMRSAFLGSPRLVNYWTWALAGTVSRKGAMPDREFNTPIFLARGTNNKVLCPK